MISQDEAIQLIRNSSRYAHALMVSAMMAGLAGRLGENEQQWRLVGLLHDLDFDEVQNNMKNHGIVAAERLRGKLPKECIYAVKAHDYRAGFAPRSRIDKALIATDSLASIIGESGKKVEELDVDAVKALAEDAFTNRPWLKSNLMKHKEIGLESNEFLELCLDSWKQNPDWH